MPVPDPTPEEPDPEFLRLVIEVEAAAYHYTRRTTLGVSVSDAARQALHRWHREQVERAEDAAIEKCLVVVAEMDRDTVIHIDRCVNGSVEQKEAISRVVALGTVAIRLDALLSRPSKGSPDVR